jgi:hypothetical protein
MKKPFPWYSDTRSGGGWFTLEVELVAWPGSPPPAGAEVSPCEGFPLPLPGP